MPLPTSPPVISLFFIVESLFFGWSPFPLSSLVLFLKCHIGATCVAYSLAHRADVTTKWAPQKGVLQAKYGGRAPGTLVSVSPLMATIEGTSLQLFLTAAKCLSTEGSTALPGPWASVTTPCLSLYVPS